MPSRTKPVETDVGMKLESRFDSLNQTELLAWHLAESAEPGIILGLDGELGAGKTTLVKFLCERLGIESDLVSSPTFVLIHEYEGRIPVYHFDAYRLSQPTDFLDLGADDYLFGSGVCLIEWASRIREALPHDIAWLKITAVAVTSRFIELSASGTRHKEWLEKVIGNWPENLPCTEVR